MSRAAQPCQAASVLYQSGRGVPAAPCTNPILSLLASAPWHKRLGNPVAHHITYTSALHLPVEWTGVACIACARSILCHSMPWKPLSCPGRLTRYRWHSARAAMTCRTWRRQPTPSTTTTPPPALAMPFTCPAVSAVQRRWSRVPPPACCRSRPAFQKQQGAQGRKDLLACICQPGWPLPVGRSHRPLPTDGPLWQQ